MTETDAKTKWCPFSRVELYQPNPDLPHVAVNRSDNTVQCIASACMAWRWNSPEMVQGHCGLAGSKGYFV